MKCCCCSVIKLWPIPWTAAHPTSLSFTISQSLLKLMSIESVMPSNHLILCCPLLLLPSVFPSIRVLFPVSKLLASGGQNIGTSPSASVLPVNIQDWYPLGLTGLISLSLLQPHNLKASILWHSTFFCGPTLTSVYECWKNHSFDYMDLCWQSDVSIFCYTVYVCQSFSSKEQRMK